ARYFPDPFRQKNYLNPAKLWSGMIILKVLQKDANGDYHYEETLSDALKEIEAREDYKKIVLGIEKRIIDAGGYDKAAIDILADAINGLGMLAKNPSNNSLQFRREYSLVIRDIIDGDGTGDKAREQKMTKDKYIEKFIKAPQFQDMGELVFFLENEINVREFLIASIKNIMEKTKGTASAGANITLPKWKIDQVKLPTFDDKYKFYDYFEKRGSLEWQNLLKERLVVKLNDYVTSSKFRLESDPTLLDRNKIGTFLDTLDQKVPEIVNWEVKVANKIVK
ncbi:hypothetical protein ACFL20_10525, partial [Spirochaetota bacterium]